jgi:hypothetical protein
MRGAMGILYEANKIGDHPAGGGWGTLGLVLVF